VPDDWIEALGIHDADSGSAAAHNARDKVLEPMRGLWRHPGHHRSDEGLPGLVARAQGPVGHPDDRRRQIRTPHLPCCGAYFENAGGGNCRTPWPK